MSEKDLENIISAGKDGFKNAFLTEWSREANDREIYYWNSFEHKPCTSCSDSRVQGAKCTPATPTQLSCANCTTLSIRCSRVVDERKERVRRVLLVDEGTFESLWNVCGGAEVLLRILEHKETVTITQTSEITARLSTSTSISIGAGSSAGSQALTNSSNSSQGRSNTAHLQASLNDARNALRETLEAYEGVISSNKTLLETNTDLLDRIRSHEDDKEASLRSANQHQHQIDELKLQVLQSKGVKLELEAVLREKDDLERRAEAAEKKNEDLATEFQAMEERLVQNMNDWEARMGQKEQELRDVRDREAEATKKLEEEVARTVELRKSQKEALHSQIRLEERLASCTTDLEQAHAENERLQSSEKAVENLTQQLSEAYSRISGEETANAELNKELDEVKTARSELREELEVVIRQKEEKNAALEASNQALSDMKAQCDSNVSKLRSQEESAKEDRRKLDKRIRKLNDDLSMEKSINKTLHERYHRERKALPGLISQFIGTRYAFAEGKIRKDDVIERCDHLGKELFIIHERLSEALPQGEIPVEEERKKKRRRTDS